MDSRRYFGLSIILILCLAVWGTHLLGGFEFPEGLLYDFLVNVTPKQKNGTEKIILIETDYSLYPKGDEVWLELLNTLLAMQPRAVVFSFLPRHVSKEFYAAADKADNIFFAQQYEREKHRGQLEPLPAQAAGLNLRLGLLAPPPATYGVHRRYETGYTTAEGCKPSLAQAVFDQSRKKTADHCGIEPFFINFFQCSPSLPTLSYEQIIFGGITPDLLRDKVVLIGFSDTLYFHGFETPVNIGNEGMSLVEYSGYALETLLDNKKLHPADKWIVLVLLCLVAACGFFAYQLLSPVHHLTYTAAVLGLIIFFSWTAVHFFHLWLPVAELAGFQIALFLSIPLARLIVKDQFNQKILLAHSTSLQKRFFPESFAEAEEYWPHVINMINQTLNLERSIFLETVQGDHRVREVIGQNCSLDDVSERRRDFQRNPYRTVLAEGKPIRVSGYLVSGAKNEEQFMVALKTADRILGFWAFGFLPEKFPDQTTLLNTAQSFSQEISLVLQDRQQVRQRQKTEQQSFRKLLKFQAGESVGEQLGQIMSLTERKFKILESVINALNTATILYDPFGRVVQVNEQMAVLLRENGLQPFSSSALDLASQLTEKTMEDTRKLLNQVIVNKKNIHLPAAELEANGRSFVLAIHPLTRNGENRGDSEAKPFQMLGILFELINISDLLGKHQLKEELFFHTNTRLRQELEALLCTGALLEQNDLAPSKSKETISLLNKQSRNMREIVEQVDGFLSKNLQTEPLDLFPFNPVTLVKEAVRSLEKEAQKNRIAFLVTAPQHTELVWAGPDALKELITAILTVLLQDSTPNTSVVIDIAVEAATVICTLKNSGYGFPDATFQSYVFDANIHRSDEFQQIHAALPVLSTWNARLSGESSVGHGIRFELVLQFFWANR